MKTAAELRVELAQAEAQEAKAKVICIHCDGAGWFEDTTYDRSGDTYAKCSHCRGTGLPEPDVKAIIAAALAPHMKPRPASAE